MKSLAVPLTMPRLVKCLACPCVITRQRNIGTRSYLTRLHDRFAPSSLSIAHPNTSRPNAATIWRPRHWRMRLAIGRSGYLLGPESAAPVVSTKICGRVLPIAAVIHRVVMGLIARQMRPPSLVHAITAPPGSPPVAARFINRSFVKLA